MSKLTFCDYHNMVAILEKTEHNTDFHQIVDFLEASPLRIETADGETHIIAKINGEQVTVSESSIRRKLKLKDMEGISDFPDTDLFENLSRMDEPASPLRDASHEEAFPTATSLDAWQDRENIPKTSAMPHESSLRVTSLGGDEGSLKLNELIDFCTKLQKDAQTTRGDVQEDAPNRGGMMDQREDFGIERDSNKSIDKGSESIGEMENVLSCIGAANILASGGLKEVFTIASPPIPPVSLYGSHC
ncbi:hypothetical protein Tco_0831365 [Tanacetum coccineum]